MKFFKPNTDFLDDHNEKGRYILVWRLCLIVSFLFIVAGVLTYFSDPYTCILYFVSLSISIASFIYLQITKKVKHVFWIFTICASIVVTFSMNTLLSTMHYPDFIWAICTIVFAYIGLGKKYGLIFLIFHLLSVSYFFFFGINDHLVRLKPLDFVGQVAIFMEMITVFFTLTYLINQHIHFQTYTEKQLLLANEQLYKKNKEITLLMKEIHHRIKNNLQLVISLLRMQRDEINSEEIQEHFTEAINRVMSISVIHQKLYQNEDLKDFNFEAYIHELINEIKLMNENHKQIEIELKIDISDIGLKTLVPMGLLLNELLTNSYKHAFQDEHAKMQISIRIDQCAADKICMEYEDSGKWNQKMEKGFGLELVDLLTSQLEGSSERVYSKYKFRLSNLDLE